jgi:hypothetical protein
VDYAERLDTAMDDCKIPNHMRQGLRDYVLRHKRSGDFLMSVLQNDFAQAASRADSVNCKNDTIIRWSWLLHSGGIPNDAWGSKEKVDEWLKGVEVSGDEYARGAEPNPGAKMWDHVVKEEQAKKEQGPD